jgi:hypothetical protein
MSEIAKEKELIQCARCKSTMLVKYFSVNKKGELYKTCDNCREKRRKNNPNSNKKLTIEECQQVAKERGGKCLSTKYKNTSTKMLWECSEGHQWESKFDIMKSRGNWCPQCYDKRRGDTCRGNIKDCQRLAEERGGKCLSKKYKNNKEKMLWECSKGHQWESRFDLMKSKGNWCPQCAIKKRANLHRCDIKECHQVAESRGGKFLSTEYKHNKENRLWECSEGHQWEACFAHIKYSKSWCPVCAGSRSEELARELMEECYGEKFQKVRPEWLEGLELDGYNEDLKIGFEYNGRQHYEYRPHFHRNGIEDLYKQQKNDHKKYEICKERGIHLIVIPNEYSYQDEDEMRNFLEKNL